MSTGSTFENAGLLQARLRIPDTVVYRAFAHETVVLNLNTGLYHGVNSTGGRMLDVIAKAPSLADAAAILADEFEVPLDVLSDDLCNFCAGLLERGLLAVEST